MNFLVWFYSLVFGIGIGGPASKLIFLNQSASFESPVDMRNYNVFYDLATLHGDINSDGILSQDEYNEFSNTDSVNSFKKLIPDNLNNAKDENGNLLVDNSFSLIGILPVSNSDVYFYTYSNRQISSTYIQDGYYNYSSSNWFYDISYYNNPTIVDDVFIDGNLNTFSMEFINEYSLGKDGYFSKFLVSDRKATKQDETSKNSDGSYLMRIKPKLIEIKNKNDVIYKKEINNCELVFDSNYWSDERKMKNTLFSENTVEIKDSVIDGFLCVNDSDNTGTGWRFLFGTLNGNEKTTVNSAHEFYYYFFNLDGFEPDDIISITYNYVPVEWKYTYYNSEANYYVMPYYYSSVAKYVQDSAQKGIVDYTREQAKRIVNDSISTPYYVKNEGKKDEQKYYLDYSESIGSRVTRTINYDDDFQVKVNVPGIWRGTKHERKVNIKSIVDMKNIDSQLGEVKQFVSKSSKTEYDLNEQLRGFLKGEYNENVTALYDNCDHNKYRWAFLIHEDNWIREAKYTVINEYSKVLSMLWAYLSHGAFTYSDKLSKIECTSHEPDGVLVTYMKVVKDNKIYDLNVISNPQSVRKNYIVGYAAPGILDIMLSSTNSFFTKYGWIFWIVLAAVILLVLGILGIIFKPVKRILIVVFKVVLYSIKLIINTAYILLIWWWIAIIKKARKEELPPTWLFKKR